MISFVVENFTVIVTASLGFLLLVYWYLTKEYGKFEAKGIFSIKPTFFFGNTADAMLQRKSFPEMHRDIYEKFGDQKYGIFYDGTEACFYARHPDMVKQVMIKDFDHFTDFGFMPDLIQKMSINDFGLANTTGEHWKSLKAAIIPAFSLKNMKTVTPTVNNIAKQVVQVKKKAAATNEDVSVEEMVSHFAMDCITQIAFGMKVDAVKNPDAQIVSIAANMFESWRFIVSTLMPRMAWLFNMSIFNSKSCSYFEKLGRNIIQERDKIKGGNYNDVIGLMMKLRDDNVKIDDSEDNDFGLGNVKRQRLSNDTIAKTIMQFFIDGYDSVTVYITYVFYFLAVNPDIQEKVIAEVDEVAEKCNNGEDITGELVNELKYLDQVISESARLAPVAAFTARICTKDWTIPGTNVTIPKGMRAYIPIIGLHMDPELHPDPETFNPDRFSGENRSKIVTGSYLPFGTGPRQCIGMKIARLETKLLLFQMLHHYRLEPGSKLQHPFKWSISGINRIEGGCWVKLIDRHF